MYGDNWSVIQSATILESELKKKHVAISYHYVREAIAAGYINAHFILSWENFSDILTKALGGNLHAVIVTAVMV